MARLIDAYALIDNMEGHVTTMSVCSTTIEARAKSEMKRTCISDVANAPTIPAIPVEWLEHMMTATTLARTSNAIKDVLAIWKRMGQKEQGGEIMADFVQIMKDWRRMCAGIKCSECEIFNYCEGLPNADADKIERIVTAWAAEHPEPVYPTWAEYISKRIIHEMCEGEIRGPETVLTYAMNKPIPADIAEKLGVQPKEGTC